MDADRVVSMIEEINEAETVAELLAIVAENDELGEELPAEVRAAGLARVKYFTQKTARVPDLLVAPASTPVADDAEMVSIPRFQLKQLVSLADKTGAREVAGRKSTTGRLTKLYKLGDTSALRVFFNPNSGKCPQQAVVIGSVLITYFKDVVFSEADLFQALDAHSREIAPNHPDSRRGRAVWAFYCRAFVDTGFVVEL